MKTWLFWRDLCYWIYVARVYAQIYALAMRVLQVPCVYLRVSVLWFCYGPQQQHCNLCFSTGMMSWKKNMKGWHRVNEVYLLYYLSEWSLALFLSISAYTPVFLLLSIIVYVKETCVNTNKTISGFCPPFICSFIFQGHNKNSGQFSHSLHSGAATVERRVGPLCFIVLQKFQRIWK